MCTANGEVRGLGLYFYFILVFFLFTRHTQLLWDWEKRGVAGWNVVCPSERVLMLPDKGSTNGDSIIIYVKCIHVDHFFISNRKSRSNHFINFSIGILSPQGQHRREKRNLHPFILVRNYSTLNEEILEEDAGPKMQVMSRAWVD